MAPPRNNFTIPDSPEVFGASAPSGFRPETVAALQVGRGQLPTYVPPISDGFGINMAPKGEPAPPVYPDGKSARECLRWAVDEGPEAEEYRAYIASLGQS